VADAQLRHRRAIVVAAARLARIGPGLQGYRVQSGLYRVVDLIGMPLVGRASHASGQSQYMGRWDVAEIDLQAVGLRVLESVAE